MAQRFSFQKRSDSNDPKEIVRTEVMESGYREFLEKDALENERNANLSFLQSVEIVEAGKNSEVVVSIVQRTLQRTEKLSDTTARIVYRLPVGHSYLNPAKGLHGGQQAAIFDTFTSWLFVLIRKPGFWMRFGTSRALNISYLRPAMEGEMLRLEAEIVHAGKKLALVKGVLKRESDGKIVSTCEHHKFNDDDSAHKL